MENKDLCFENEGISEEQIYKEDIPSKLLVYESRYMVAFLNMLEKIDDFEGLIYPITFLLSHYMELWVKNRVFFISMDYFMWDLEGLELNSHSVTMMLNDEFIIKLLLDNNIEQNDINEVKSLYEYFDKLVEKTNLSEGMRYPIKLKNNVPTIILSEIDNVDTKIYKKNAKRLIELTAEVRQVYTESVLKDSCEICLKAEYWLKHGEEYNLAMEDEKVNGCNSIVMQKYKTGMKEYIIKNLDSRFKQWKEEADN